jgi:hypothetical protein
MSLMQFSDTTPNDPPQRPAGLWHSLRSLWCRHRETAIAPKADGMPAHVVCQTCGWREPVMAAAPQATRTWDSSRDEARYRLEKKRRAAVDEQRQLVMAKLATPGPRGRTRSRTSSSNLLHMKPAVGE